MPASARVQQPDRPTQDDSPAMDLDSPAGTSSSATMTTASLSKQEPGTLFVRNLALTTTKEELVSYFSEIGPVKRGIVVCEKKSQGGASKGFGFVVFALASDADEAIRLLKDQAELQGRKLALDVAGPKGVKRPLQDSSLKRISLPAPAATAGEPQPSSAPGLSAPAALDDSEDADKRAVILFNLPEDFSDKQLQIRLRKSERKVLQVERDGSRARVLFETPGAAHAAVQELDKRTWGGGLVFARRPQQMATKSRAMGRCRLIVRNLGFKVNEPRLRQAFELHGPVSDVVVSRGEDGKSRGFGFVQFVCRQDAEKAVQALNGEVSLGPAGKDRPVAVDFCLAKHRYELLKRLATAPAEDGAAKEDGGAAESGKESEEEEEEGKPQAAAAALPKRDSGVSQGRTLFVQNLLFETTEDVVRTRFREFGPVRGVKMVRDAQGRSKGTAFVEFWEQATCAKAMQAPMPLMLEGRPVYASLAVDKATAERLTSKEEKPAKSDKRHMYLAAEGRVSVEDVPKGDRAKRASAEAEKKDKLKSPMFFVSPTRLSVRNLNRKADEVIDSKELKKLALDAAVRGLKQGVVKDNEGDRTLFPAPGIQPWPKVLKATVFFEDDAKTSRGFGFVEFSEHIHALAALRVLNNTPDFGWAAAGGRAAMKVKDEDRPRLIVSFTVENAAKVRTLELRKASTGKDMAAGVKRSARVAEESVEPVGKKLRVDAAAKPAGAVVAKPAGAVIAKPVAAAVAKPAASRPPRPPRTNKRVMDQDDEIDQLVRPLKQAERDGKAVRSKRKRAPADEVDALVQAHKSKALFDTHHQQQQQQSEGGSVRGRWYD